MLESGIVSLKNEVNIMMKNVVDVVLGGVTYWAFGYGLSYGSGDDSCKRKQTLLTDQTTRLKSKPSRF